MASLFFIARQRSHIKQECAGFFYQHWIVGVRGVGGAIDAAVITRTDGFTDVQKKKITGE